MILNELGQVTACVPLGHKEELDAAGRDVPHSVEDAGHVDVRRELRDFHQQYCNKIEASNKLNGNSAWHWLEQCIGSSQLH